jgi:hypothetical protein
MLIRAFTNNIPEEAGAGILFTMSGFMSYKDFELVYYTELKI